jgi:hypothetical protein
MLASKIRCELIAGREREGISHGAPLYFLPALPPKEQAVPSAVRSSNQFGYRELKK